jgi:hypothetical protein
VKKLKSSSQNPVLGFTFAASSLLSEHSTILSDHSNPGDSLSANGLSTECVSDIICPGPVSTAMSGQTLFEVRQVGRRHRPVRVRPLTARVESSGVPHFQTFKFNLSVDAQSPPANANSN